MNQQMVSGILPEQQIVLLNVLSGTTTQAHLIYLFSALSEYLYFIQFIKRIKFAIEAVKKKK